ncbi:MAG: thermonuclease family protein [Pseudomonadota bacterium]|nr:thermonuclease family protein [Pseudomonadota bacterium]
MRFNFFLAFIIIFLSGNVNSEEFNGVVTKVIDGDSVVVRHDNVLKKIRLSYIDAPEVSQDHGENSKIFLKNIVLDKMVLVDTKRKDKYGRHLSDLYIHSNIESIYVNAKMIKSGNAWVYKRYRSNTYLINLENHARSNKIGIWKNDNPMEPWVYRKSYK